MPRLIRPRVTHPARVLGIHPARVPGIHPARVPGIRPARVPGIRPARVAATRQFTGILVAGAGVGLIRVARQGFRPMTSTPVAGTAVSLIRRMTAGQILGRHQPGQA